MKQEFSTKIVLTKTVFDESLDEIKQLFSFNENIATITDDLFESLARYAEGNNGHLIASKARVLKTLMHNLYRHTSLRVSLNMLYESAVVNSVSSLESYLSALFAEIAKGNSDKVVANMPKDLKLPRSLLVEHGLGIENYIDQIIMLNDGKINFQDLQSIIRTFEEYFGIKLKPDASTRDDVILAQATRHCILHRRGVIDHKFMHQIRETKYANDYKLGAKLYLDKARALAMVQSIEKFASITYERIEEVYEKSKQ